MAGRRSRRARLLCFAIFAALAVAGPDVLRAQPPRGQDIHQDFRGSKPLTDEWKMIGQNRDAVIKPEEEGLRIAIPKTSKSYQPVGVRLMFSAAGDFEITGAYQLLSADVPAAGGAGVGVALNLVSGNDYKKFVRFGRFVQAKGENIYVVECRNKDVPKDNQFKTIPTEARSGQLRLIREGSKLRYLVADNPPNVFREIHQGVFTDDDLEIVRFAVNNNNTPSAVEVRLVDLRIRFGNPGEAQANASATPVGEDARPPSRSWLLAALVIGFAIILVFAAVGVLFALRRRTKAASPAEIADDAEKPEPGSPLIVMCAGCGKKLRVRPGSSGKKTKCQQCGKLLWVP